MSAWPRPRSGSSEHPGRGLGGEGPGRPPPAQLKSLRVYSQEGSPQGQRRALRGRRDGDSAFWREPETETAIERPRWFGEKPRWSLWAESCHTFWPSLEPRLPARVQTDFGSQGSWAGGSPRWAISSVQVSCRRRSSSSVSLSTTSSRVCPSTALILWTTWDRQVVVGQQPALWAAHGLWHHPRLARLTY